MRYPATVRTRTLAQESEVLERRALLRRRLAAVRAVQAIYMPCTPRLLAEYQMALQHQRPPGAADAVQGGLQTRSRSNAEYHDVLDLPEDQPLYLPSSLQQDDLDACVEDLANNELRLREGQLHDSLEKVRIHLHIKSRLLVFKARNVRHQGPNTRAMAQLDANEGKIIMYAEKYRAARIAKMSLSGRGPWEQQWKVLHTTDVRCMREEEPEERVAGLETIEQRQERARGERRSRPEEAIRTAPGESRRQVSWIWNSADTVKGGEEVDGMTEGELHF